MITTDKYNPTDRSEIISLLRTVPNLTSINNLEEKTVEQDFTHIHIARENGKIVGVAIWLKPALGGEAELVCILTDEGSFCNTLLNSKGTFTTYYKLIVACIEEALNLGLTKGVFTIRNKALINILKTTFNINPTVIGKNLDTGEEVFEIHVELNDALKQVMGVISG